MLLLSYPTLYYMSSKFRSQTLIIFFLTISILITYTVIVGKQPPDPALKAAQQTLALEKLAIQREHLRRNADVVFYGAAGMMVAACLSGVIVASGKHRAQVKRASVHEYVIAGSKVIVHERDLALAAPVALGLMNAAQLKEMNGGMEKAFELSCRMAELQNHQLKALMSGSRALQALPESTDHEEEHVSGQIPTFRELVQSDEIARGKPMILGYRDGVPRRGSYLDIYSAAVAGESGSGKTATLLYLIGAGLIAEGVRYYGIDPHYPHPKSLAFKTKALWEAGLMRMATQKDAILDLLREIDHLIDLRISQVDTDTTPMVLVIDELAFLSKTTIRAQLAHTMERVSTEGRKCAIYMLASSQTWLVARSGESSVVRDTLTSAYVHRIKPKQANLLLQDKEQADIVRKKIKRPGEVLFCPTHDDPVILQMPYTTEHDMNLVIDLVNRGVNRQHIDSAVDQRSQLTGLVRAEPVDLVAQVNGTLKKDGDFMALVKSTGFDKAYISRILNRKQSMSKNAEQRLKMWLAGGCASP
jgi:hypothetical protein